MAKSTASQTDFDDEIDDQAQSDATQRAVAKDEDGVPYCAKHHCRMRQTSGGKAGSPVAYFRCPVDECEEKEKRIKSARPVIPAEPLKCPRCAGLSPQPIMERDGRVSTLMYTILKCPCCGHKSAPLARPEFVENHARSRGARRLEDIGAR